MSQKLYVILRIENGQVAIDSAAYPFAAAKDALQNRMRWKKNNKAGVVFALADASLPLNSVEKRIAKLELRHGKLARFPVKKNPRSRKKTKKASRTLSVPERHQLRIARDTLKMHDAAVSFMGGPSKAEAREIIKRLTGSYPKENPHKAGSADKAAAKELLLFIENDGELYRQQTTAIQKNLTRKFKKGKYSSTKAAKLWGYLADNGAKKYSFESGDRGNARSWHQVKGYGIFTAATRRLTARLLEKSWHAEMKAGNFHD